ncbi:MAG: hypothetical protein E6Q92_08050 [Burkholderiaceae bacterium]|nr:MAG: hypothetical protein E6Q92_08050 [Burkholderiaceae bacterium]
MKWMKDTLPRGRHGVRMMGAVLGLVSLGGLGGLHALAQAGSQAQSQATAVPARLIVRFKSDAQLDRRYALAAGDPAQPLRVQRSSALAQRTGLALSSGMGISDRDQVVFAAGVGARQAIEALSRDPAVEWAVEDQRRHRTSVPNDPLYASGPGNTGPAAGQWYLKPSNSTLVAATNAEGAWTLVQARSSSLSGVVVAVLDTGVRFDHPDLLAVASGGKLLPGYDMVADTATANDGGGRDADPSDPGDWISSADAASSTFTGCTVEDSSWHGTQVSGIVGALSNNGIGMTGMSWNAKLLPMRVLGKCGGYDSDIIAGMRWASGLSVDGTPANPNPAQVLNLSLGGSGSCSAAYSSAISEIRSKTNAVIVVAAGNSTGAAVGAPGNCSGVITVAGLRHVGSKVGYSDVGSEISIAAPGGNCVNTNGSCLYPILSTANAGTTGPGASIYTDGINYGVGTSFAAPQVAGVVAMMRSVNPSMTADQVRTALQSTARTFPASGLLDGDGKALVACTAPQYDGAGKVRAVDCKAVRT